MRSVLGGTAALPVFLIGLSGLGVLAGVACSSDDGAPPAVPIEAGEPPAPVCEGDLEAFRFPGGTDGHADPLGAKAAGQARAGRIRDAAQIVQPANARHAIRPGDFLLANDRIAVYVEAEGESDGYDPYGGEILAIEPLSAEGKPLGISQYGESLFALSRQTVAPEKVTVLNDGSDGKAAVVRASGTLKSIPFLDTFAALVSEEYDYPAALDYVLEPGSSRILLRLSLVNTKTEANAFSNKQFFGFFQQARSQSFTETQGFGEPLGEVPYVAWDGAGGMGFLVRPLQGTLRAELGISGFQFFSTKGTSLEGCETKTFDYAEIVAGAPGVDGLLEAKRSSWNEPAWREVRGTLTEATSRAPLAGASVHATAPDGTYLTRATTDETGGFVIHVPPGAVNLTPILKGWTMPAATPVGDGATIDLTLPQHGTIVVDATDATTSEALPVRVQIVPVTPLVPVPPAFGVVNEVDGRLWQEYAVTGHAELAVPPGAHRVIVTRGYEYEVFDSTVTVAAGETASVAAPLLHSVDTTGVMCADFHIHSYYSADSSDVVESKIKGAIADGLDIPVSSEHEYVIDFMPLIRDMGLARWAYSFPSEELTTFTWGHFGVVPLTPKPDAVNRGAIGWVGKTPGQIFDTVNALPEKPVLIVNHPSSGGFTAYFSAAGFNRTTATGDPSLWSPNFSAVEVFNDSDYETNRNKSVGDYYALLDAGGTYWLIGNSDSHHNVKDPAGYPRNCLAFGHDDPTKLSAEIVRDVLRVGHSTVSGGLYMTVSGPDGKGPGETSQRGAYTVTVAAPSWLSMTELEVIVDGKTAQTLPLTPSGAGPGKRATVTVNVAEAQSSARHYVVFHAKGDGDLSPLHPGRKPFAASNPIFF